MSKLPPQLAPVGLSVYGRVDHLQCTVDALQKNTLAEKTELYVFSDAPSPGDEQKVEAVRAYLKTVEGFRHVEIVERRENDRVFNNRDGMRQLADHAGRFIYLEEDVATAPGFLSFMNEALSVYGDHPDVFSITGYTPPLKWDTDSDVFALPRFCAWGMGLTKENYELVQPIPEDALAKLDQETAEKCGRDVYAMIRMQSEGKIDAFDVMAMYHQCLSGRQTIYPKSSLIENTGHDGSGLHCRKTDSFHNPELWDKIRDFNFPAKPVALDSNVSRMREFRDSMKPRKPKWRRVLKKWRQKLKPGK